jgi:hypothetical protein
MSKADEIIKKILTHNENLKYWYDLSNEIQDFFKSNYPEKEKDKIRKDWSLMERVCMLADAYEYEQRKKQNKEN